MRGLEWIIGVLLGIIILAILTARAEFLFRAFGSRSDEKIARDSRISDFLIRFILCPLIIGWGVVCVVTQKSGWAGSLDVRGFDAVCFGIGEIGLGVGMFALHNNRPDQSEKTGRIRAVVATVGLVIFVVGSLTAVFRNI